jgi:hypothetical protein
MPQTPDGQLTRPALGPSASAQENGVWANFRDAFAVHLYALWYQIREFAYGLRLVWLATASLVVGCILFLTPQAQDLFLEVRGTVATGAWFWLQFYLAVLLIWVLPIYVSSRWLLWQFRKDLSPDPERRPVAEWARRLIPPLIAAMCPLALLLGQALALLNVPDLVDLTRIEDNIEDHKQEVARLCTTIGSDCIVAVGRLLGDSSLWILRTEWGLGTEWMIFLLYVFCFGLIAWNLIGRLPRYIGDRRWRVAARITWWLITIVTLPIVLLMVLVFYGYLWAEAQSPHTVVHLALLPAVSIACSYILWQLLRPHPTHANLMARFMLADTHAVADEATAMRLLVRPIYLVLIALSIVATFALLFLNPLDVTNRLSRVQLVPFLLGPLIPPLTYLSNLAARAKAPFVVGAVVLIGIANSLVSDGHAVRTVPLPPNLQRQSLDQSVLQWAAANGCDISRAESCPSPVIIAAAGGASRAAFLVAGLIGKLIDERTTLAALGPNMGQPSRNLRPFENQLFAVSGVSGGSLGAVMSYAALADRMVPPNWPAPSSSGGAPAIAPPCRAEQTAAHAEWYGSSVGAKQPLPPHESWQSCLGLLLAGDFLSPVLVKLMSTDLVGLGLATDRGVTLEQAWERRYFEITGKNTLARGISQVRAEAAGRGQWLPILLLNGTSVEVGRRIITSDVDMSARSSIQTRMPVQTPDRQLLDFASQPLRVDKPFIDASNVYELIDDPEAQPVRRAGQPVLARDLALSTAATMSARFPVISPHGSITDGGGTILDRVVDGGYYENFGASTALELARLLKTRYRLAPMVILVNNEPTTEAMDCVTDETQVSPRANPAQRMWFSAITSPLDAISQTRRARGSHAAVELCTYVRSPEVGGAFAFITVRKSGDKPLSMSWWLSKHVQQYLALHLAPDDGTTEDTGDRDRQFRLVNQKAFIEIVRHRLLPTTQER